jgi:hypothetical protein
VCGGDVPKSVIGVLGSPLSIRLFLPDTPTPAVVSLLSIPFCLYVCMYVIHVLLRINTLPFFRKTNSYPIPQTPPYSPSEDFKLRPLQLIANSNTDLLHILAPPPPHFGRHQIARHTISVPCFLENCPDPRHVKSGTVIPAKQICSGLCSEIFSSLATG